MNKWGSTVAGALVFGLVAGAAMVGVNAAAIKTGMLTQVQAPAAVESAAQLPERSGIPAAGAET